MNFNIDEAYKLYKNGKSLTDLSKIYNIDSKTIWQYFKKNNLYIRTKSEALKLKKNKYMINEIIKIKDGNGYFRNYIKLIYNDNIIYKPYSIYLIEKNIKRKLGTNEVVHHKNMNKLDDRLENLQIMNNKDHSKLHSITNNFYDIGRIIHSKKCKNKRKELSPLVLQKIENGQSYRNIAKELKISRNTITKIIKESNGENIFKLKY